ncbi:hypothetical protein L9F63_017437 [Diploptera punctata]|uniref:Uncharacterized protein n=1 Tax=Diploptera punctata TaxID=6984 RepID=A0AAD8EGS3_DIPPU|nr:hypothetical protein L9F63_017437 [Diploptera punctata]
MENVRIISSDSSNIGRTEEAGDEDTIRTEENEMLTTETSTISSISLFDEDKINKICLTFCNTESPTKRQKIKMFWKYVDSRPDLDAMKVTGWNEQELMEQRATYLSKDLLLEANYHAQPGLKAECFHYLQNEIAQLEKVHNDFHCIQDNNLCSYRRENGILAYSIRETPQEILSQLPSDAALGAKTDLPGYVERSRNSRAAASQTDHVPSSKNKT